MERCQVQAAIAKMACMVVVSGFAVTPLVPLWQLWPIGSIFALDVIPFVEMD